MSNLKEGSCLYMELNTGILKCASMLLSWNAYNAIMQNCASFYAQFSCPFQCSSGARISISSDDTLFLLDFNLWRMYSDQETTYSGNVYPPSRKFLIHSNVRLNNLYSSNLKVRSDVLAAVIKFRRSVSSILSAKCKR